MLLGTFSIIFSGVWTVWESQQWNYFIILYVETTLHEQTNISDDFFFPGKKMQKPELTCLTAAFAIWDFSLKGLFTRLLWYSMDGAPDRSPVTCCCEVLDSISGTSGRTKGAFEGPLPSDKFQRKPLWYTLISWMPTGVIFQISSLIASWSCAVKVMVHRDIVNWS